MMGSVFREGPLEGLVHGPIARPFRSGAEPIRWDCILGYLCNNGLKPSGVSEDIVGSRQRHSKVKKTGRGRDSPADRDLLQPDPGLHFTADPGRTDSGDGGRERKKKRRRQAEIEY